MISTRGLDHVVDRVAELLLQRIGLRPDPTLRGRISRAVVDEMGDPHRDPVAYFDSVAGGGAALQRLLNRVTVQETAFFRHPEQFDVLARDVLPTLSRPVRIWSAGCANGQEAFSLAMLLQEQGIDGSVIGSDLSTSAVQRTAAARYSTRELSGLTPRRMQDNLTRTADSWLVNSALRDRVRVLHHNLLDPLPPEIQTCQVIFCRNVLIYLSPASARAFLERIADTFPPSTAVFVGSAETIWQVSDRFQAIPAGATFFHRQARVGAAPVRARAGQRSTQAASVPATVEPENRRRRRPVTREQPMPKPIGPRRRAAQFSVLPESATPAELMSRAGQDAIAAGYFDAAVVAFRKCAYLTPHDPLAQLHLGLALEAAGDDPSAQRAYAAARHALGEADLSFGNAGLKGYSGAELKSLLDAKNRRLTR